MAKKLLRIWEAYTERLIKLNAPEQPSPAGRKLPGNQPGDVRKVSWVIGIPLLAAVIAHGLAQQ